MFSKKLLAGAAVAAVVLPALAFAETNTTATDRESQIRALVEQIQTLQKQLTALIASSGSFKPVGLEGVGLTSGQISAVNSSSITVENRQASKSVVVNYTASTTIEVFKASSTPQWQSGTTADLVVGRGVVVQGSRVEGSENTVNASRIKVGIALAMNDRIKSVPPGQVGKALCIALNRNLGPGSRGEDVKKLQEMLREDKSLGFTSDATGIFGPLTAKAMMMYQRKNGINPADDGSVGPLTRGVLMRNCGRGLDNSGSGSWNSGKSKPGDDDVCNGVNAPCDDDSSDDDEDEDEDENDDADDTASSTPST